MRLIIPLFALLTIISGCNIFNNDEAARNFFPIQPNQFESFMQGEVITGFTFETKDDLGEIQEITDSLRFTWSIDALWFNTYSDSPENILDSLENEYVNNPLIVFSQEQLKIAYGISVDETTVIKDSTFTFVSEDMQDTSKVVVSSQEMENIYSKAGFTFSEKDTAVINNFDLDNEFQNESFKRFKGGVEANRLEWLPDSNFKPNVPFFRIEGNTVIFGVFENSKQSVTYNLMQKNIIEQYRSFIEQL